MGTPERPGRAPDPAAQQGGSGRRKVFVGGLPWRVTNEDLAREFERFGRVKNAFVVKDKGTAASRGFGFVEFASPETAQALLEARTVLVGGRRVECKETATRKAATSYGERRVRVPVPRGCPLADVRTAFEAFGAVEHLEARGGLVYVTFSERRGVVACLAQPRVECGSLSLVPERAPVEARPRGMRRPARQQQQQQHQQQQEEGEGEEGEAREARRPGTTQGPSSDTSLGSSLGSSSSLPASSDSRGTAPQVWLGLPADLPVPPVPSIPDDDPGLFDLFLY